MLRALALFALATTWAALGRAQPPDAPGFAGDSPEELNRIRDAFIAEHGDLPITAVDVDGLRRTHRVVVDQFVRVRSGDPLSSCDLGELYERLYRLAIFSRVAIELAPEGEGVAVRIHIDEKWTLYPVPLVWLFQGTEVVGMVLAEANAFGYNKGWALGGLYSNRGWYTIAAYSDPNIAFSDFWGRLGAFVGSGAVENDRPDGTVAQSFDLTRVDVQYVVGWTLWDRLSPAWTGALRWGQVETVNVAGLEPPQSVTFVDQGLKLIYSNRKYRFYYDEGVRLSVELQHGFPLDGASPAYDGVILDGVVTTPSFGASSVELAVHATLSSFPVVFEDRLGGTEGSRTLPGGGVVAADRYLSATLAYQVPIISAGIGTLTGVVFAEAGAYARNDEPSITYGGPGAGLRFYLREVTVPAVGIDIGYELRSERPSFSLVVGYRPTR
jgi:outer membrane protein assembly factor BamA